ncbi:hypothetical protein CGRA01v4_08338 [Colletotrichum graminicola]|nr:hypothetical protein CGRA01v4_08338 [Colletotrichum graminicola]
MILTMGQTRSFSENAAPMHPTTKTACLGRSVDSVGPLRAAWGVALW